MVADGSTDMTPKEHILVDIKESEHHIDKMHFFQLIDKIAGFGIERRTQKRLTRERFRELVSNFVMRPVDHDFFFEQSTGRRKVDLEKFPPEQSSYIKWAKTQAESSPQKHGWKALVSSMRHEVGLKTY